MIAYNVRLNKGAITLSITTLSIITLIMTLRVKGLLFQTPSMHETRHK